MQTEKTPFQRACEIAGSQVALAERIGMSPSMVNQIFKGIKPVPVRYCVAIERATKGAVNRRELCADWQRIWPSSKKVA
jgi:DNA-binding transcriptional regulator YdaS (Cro superfamily)